MSAMKELIKWLALLQPLRGEKKILIKIMRHCAKLHAADEHIKKIMHKSGLTQ
jgi:hypothetical protein